MANVFDKYNFGTQSNNYNRPRKQEETGYLDALMRGGKANLQGVAGGLGHLLGAEQFAQDMQRNAQENARKREHDTVFSLDYITDPEGLAYDVGGNLGSMVALAPFAMAVPAGVATAGAGAIGAGLGRLGLSKGAQWAVSEAGKKALATGIRGAGAGVGESLAEWGSTAQEAQAQGAENPRLDTMGVFGQNLLVNPISSGLEYMLLGGKLFNPTAKAGETFATRALKAPMRALPAGGANAIQNGIEEVTQQTISDNALGLPVGDIYNPSTWTDSQRQAFEVGFASGGALAGVSSTGRALMPDIEGEKALKEQREQEQAKQEAIAEQNKNIDEYINELDNPKRDYTNEYIADLENKQGQGVYIPKRSEKPVPKQGLGELVKQPVIVSDEVRDKIRNMPSLSNAQLVAEMQQTNDAVYSQALLSEAKRRGLNVGEGFNFTNPANIVPMSTIRQEEGEKQRQQTSSVTHDADNLLLQASMEQPKMQKPQRGLSIVNRGEVGSVNQKQKEYAEPPTTEGKYLRNYEQELVNKYIGNPQLFEKDYFSAQNAVKRAFKNGDLTKEEAETNLNNLRGLYDRTAQAIRNNGVIRQTGFKKPRNIKNIISEARQKQKNEMGKIAKAVNDVKLRNRLESGVKTQIQVPYYIQNAVKEVQEIKKAKADEQRKQQVFDEMKQGATEYINSIEPEAKQEVINASLEEAKASRKELFTPLVNQLKEGMGQGVTRQYTDKETGEVVDVSDLKGKEETKNNSASYNREVYSNNAPWYQNWFKSNGRKPNNAELYEIAENIYLGNDEYGSHLLEGIENDEEALSQNKANVEYFDNLIKIYEEMGAQTTTNQEEATTETPSETAQEAPQQEQKAEPKEVVEAEEKEPVKAKSEPREDGRLTTPVTRKVSKEAEEKIKLPDRKIRVTQNDFTATLDSGVILVQSKTKGSDNPIMVEMTVDDYIKSAKETANKEAGIKRFITSKVYKAIQNWIDNSPNEKVRQARQNEYDDIGVSDNIINIVNLLAKKLLEKADIEVKGSKEAFDETKNVAPKATNETTLTQVGEKNKPTKSETTVKTEVKAYVDDLKYLSKEGKEVFQKVVDVLKTGNDKVAQSAEMGALIYARRADNYAEAMRKAGNKDYTALDYLEANPVKISNSSTDIEQGVLNQPITNTELLLDEEVEVLDFDKLSDELKGKTPKEVVEYIKKISNGVQVPTADFKAIVGLPSNADSYGRSHIVRAKSSSNARNILARNKVIANFADVISGVRLVEVSDNQKIASGNSKAQKRKNKVKKFYRLFAPVKLNNKLFTLLITAEDFDGNVGFEPKEVSLFEIETKKIKAVRASTELNSTAYNDFSKISIREVLRNVKDVNGVPYINADDTGNYVALNQTAWHGTPYEFDKFDLGSIGTGEGAQAHGWGLYFAQDEEVAKGYRARLTRTNIVARQDGKINTNITSVLNQELGGTDLYNLANGKLDKQWLKEKISQIISRLRDEKDIANRRRNFFEEQIKRIEENPKISISKFLETANSESLWELKNIVEFARVDAKKENRRANISDVLARLKKAVEPFIKQREIELRYADLLESINIDKLNVGFDGTVFEVNVPNDNVLLDEQKTLEEQPQFVKEALLEYGKRKAIKTFVDYGNKTYQYAKGSIFGEWIDINNGKYVVPKSDLYQELDNRLDESYQQEVDTNIFFSNDTGKMIYAKIKAEEGGARDASVKLNELGVKGITYNGGRDGRCFVVFDDKAISVINQFNQDDGSTTKGQAKIIDNGQRVISLFGYADESTFVHEIGHVAYADLQEQASMENAPQQIKDDLKTVDDWAEWKDGQLAEYEGTAVYDEFKQRDIAIKDALKQGRTALAEKLKYEWKQERFARGFEEYLRQGNAPSNALKKVFQKFKEWLTEIYQGYKAIGAVPSKEVQAVMDRMLLVKSETNKDNNIKFSPLDNPAYQRSLEEIYDDLNDIFEGAKVEELGNEEWRVTTPNGKRIIVKVADRIILNDKQSANMRKAHNLDSDYIAEASGYWRAIGENDVDGELVISRNSKKGTAYHEILHAVMDLALTTKEKQALIKDAMKEAKATGKDVEEVIAERYRKWVLARKKGQGTAFGKLFKKMQDFYYKLKKLFTGMENAHNIMRKIESGEVWERNGNANIKTSSQKYSEAPTKNNLNSIVVSTEPSSLSKTIKEQGIKGWLQDKAKNFYRDWVDKNDALHDYDNAIEKATGRKLTDGEKIYNKAQMMNATATGMANALIEGDEQHIKSLSKRLGRELHNVTLKKILDFINNDKMNKLFPNYLKENGYKDWVDAFGHYLAFRRLREMVKYKRELFNEEHAKWVEGGKKGKEPVFEPYKLPEGVTIQDIEKAIQNAPAPFKKASDDYYKLNDNMLIILEDAGIISKEVHKLLNDKYKEYCPLMRDFSDTAGADMFLQGLSNGGRGIANVSSTLKRISLEGSERGVINPLETTFKAVAVMANRAERNKVGQLAVSYAKLQGMEDIIRHIPTPKGGNAVADPKNSIFTVMIDGKKEAYQVIPELYSPIVGYNVPTAGFVLGVARDTARMLRTGATISPSFVIRNFIRDTIFASISSQNGFIPIVDSVKGAYALLHDAELKADFEVAGVTAFNFYKNAETAYKSLVELNGGKEINFYNPIDVIKALAKYPEEFSAFVESATRMGEFKRAREAGKSIDEATRDARELTIDFSRSGVLGENVNLVVPFFNATIQGGDKLYRLFRDNPVGTAVNVAKYIVLPSMVLWAMNYDDEEYKELDPKIKMTHWIIGDVRIPKPQEAGILFGSGIEAMLDLAMGNDPEAMKHWAKQVVDGVSPNIIPTVILPIIEWQANYSFFRDGKLVGYREERLPDELQYKDSTSELSKDLGKLTGLSPIKLDNTVRGYTGTMGMLLWQAYDIGSMDKAKLPEKKITELPLVRDFFVNDYNARRSVDDFYKLAEQADKQHAGYGVKGKPTAVVQGIRRAKQQISNINKDIRNITASNLTSSEKRERIDKKREIMHRIAKQANNRYGKFFE